MTLFSFRKKIIKRLLLLSMPSSIRVFLLRKSGYIVGKGTGIGEGFYVSDRSIDVNNVIIGNNCAIASRVAIITTSSPKESMLSKIYGIVYKPVVIEDDVWIGTNVIILPGVTIGRCSILAAGTVVDKDIPKYSVAKGNPMTIKKMNKYLIKKIEGELK